MSHQNTQLSSSNNILYEFFIFNERKQLIFYYDIANDQISNKDEVNKIVKDGRIMNICGISEALKLFCLKFSNQPITNIKYFCTNKYKYSIFESTSGIKLVILSDPQEADFGEFLKNFYTKIFIQYVVRNTMYEPGNPIDCPYFIAKAKEEFQDLKNKDARV